MAENIYFPLNGGSGGGSEAAPHITITVDDLKYDYSGTLTAEQLATLAEDNSYINFDIVTSYANMRLILNKTQVVPNEGTPTHYVFSAIINMEFNMTVSLLITVEESSYISSVFDPAFYLKGVKVNGTELDSPNNIAELNLKTVNNQSIVGTGNLSIEGGAEVIEKGINLNTNKFTTALTADEFNKLKNNEAIIKITTTYLDFFPLVLYGSNPSIMNGTAIGSDDIHDILVYAIPSPLTDNPAAVYIVVIQSDKLDSFTIKTMQANEPILGNSSTDTYGAISTNPLLGFSSSEADILQLHMSNSIYIGKFTYDSTGNSYVFYEGNDSKRTYFVSKLTAIIGLENDDKNFASFEVVLQLNEKNPNSSVIVDKYYSCIIHISSITSNASEGTFTIYDTATNKITYVILRIHARSNASPMFEMDYLKAYQDGAEITSTFVSKIEGIYLNLL